jgi:hypothetical protein
MCNFVPRLTELMLKQLTDFKQQLYETAKVRL